MYISIFYLPIFRSPELKLKSYHYLTIYYLYFLIFKDSTEKLNLLYFICRSPNIEISDKDFFDQNEMYVYVARPIYVKGDLLACLTLPIFYPSYVAYLPTYLVR